MGGIKRIVFTVTNDLSYDQRMQKICRSLSDAGYDAELVGRELSSSIPLKQERYEQVRLRCFFNKGKLFYAEYNMRLLFYLAFNQFDAVCAVDLDTIVPVYIAGRLKGAKLIYDAHEYFTEVPEVVNRPLVKSIWQWVEKTFVPKFDLLYTVSPGLASLFQKQYNKYFEVILNVPVLSNDENPQPQTSNVQPQTSNIKPFLLYQGALNEGRGIEHLIAAMRDIDCKLVLAGEGDLSNSLRQLTLGLGLQDKVEFKGYVEPAQLRQLTQNATVGINLLENKGLSYYYSLSNKFFDYIHAGIPQVCIDFPEYRAISEQYNVALLTKDTSMEEIISAVNRLLKDPTLYTLLQKNCDVCTRNLNWQREEQKLLGLYERLFR